MKTPKWLNIKGPFFENGKAYAKVTIKRWASPWLLWEASKKIDFSLELNFGKMSVNLTWFAKWFVRPIVVAKLSFKQVFGVN